MSKKGDFAHREASGLESGSENGDFAHGVDEPGAKRGLMLTVWALGLSSGGRLGEHKRPGEHKRLREREGTGKRSGKECIKTRI